MRIAIVEDNESVAKGIAYRLQDLGHAVDVLHNGADAEVFLRDDGNDVIILDINLPGLDGLTLLKTLRSREDSRPVLLLTARSETTERVAGLDAGADDYLVKPFEMAELEARIRALARRHSAAGSPQMQLGDLSFDLTARQAIVGEKTLDIPRRELSILESLMRAKGRVVSKSLLMDNVYGTGANIDESMIEVHISRLRKRLKPYHLYVQVQRGLGYFISDTPGK